MTEWSAETEDSQEVRLKALGYRLAALAIALASGIAVLTAADRPQQAFAKDWEGRHVVVKQTLFSLVYNERGRLGNTVSAKRDGLTVVTPSGGIYFQFDGRQGQDDVVGRDAQHIVDAVAAAYIGDALDVRAYRKVEPLLIARYDAGVELVVRTVRMERDTVRLSFVQMAGPDGTDDPVTSLTVKWPVPLSKSFSERDVVEKLIRPFLDVKP
jgi:hypothetical protein